MRNRCPQCGGYRNCAECSGGGANVHLNSADPRCPNCQGTGKCPACGGDGYTSDEPKRVALVISSLTVALAGLIFLTGGMEKAPDPMEDQVRSFRTLVTNGKAGFIYDLAHNELQACTSKDDFVQRLTKLYAGAGTCEAAVQKSKKRGPRNTETAVYVSNCEHGMLNESFTYQLNKPPRLFQYHASIKQPDAR